MWASGSSAQALPPLPLEMELVLVLRVWQSATSASALRSGMKSATRKATTTVHAPSRKGGPGIIVLYREERNKHMSEQTNRKIVQSEVVEVKCFLTQK